MDKSETKTPFWKNKHNLISFAAGMLVMLLITAGITSAVNPSFFTGTMANKSDIIVYRMFPDKVTRIPNMQEGQVYLGEIKILPMPREKLAVDKQFSLCEGQEISIYNNAALYSIIGDSYGGDYTKFGLPNLKNSLSIPGFAYYITVNGLYPYTDEYGKVVSRQGSYVPFSFSDDGSYCEYLVIGEIIPVKTSDPANLNGKLIPCEGQTLSSGDYPALAAVLGFDTATFKIPNLRGLSPVEGTQYYISSTGLFSYHDPIPEGTMRCNSCGSVVPRAKFCCECGARNSYYY
jgi:microcystin-dependent protein